MTLLEAKNILSLKPEFVDADFEKRVQADLSKVLILKSSWYPEIMDSLEQSARDYLIQSRISPEVIVTQQVPGTFELPLALLNSYPFDFAVALGCVIQGDTPHFEFVCSAATQGIMQAQLSLKTPVGFGVLTVSSIDQALARKDKGAEAAQAAYFMYLHKMQNASGDTVLPTQTLVKESSL